MDKILKFFIIFVIIALVLAFFVGPGYVCVAVMVFIACCVARIYRRNEEWLSAIYEKINEDKTDDSEK